MIRVRLSPAASISPIETGVILSSDLGTFRLHGADISVFVEQMIPLLNGTSSREEIASSVDGYSEASVLQFLSMLDERGLLEPVNDDDDEASFGPQERLAKALSSDILCRLRETRVLVVGLEPWGVVAATELAATGVGNLILVDDRTVDAEDLLSVRVWNENQIGVSRTTALRETLTSLKPQCTVDSHPLQFDAEGALSTGTSKYDLVITGLAADDHMLLHGVSRFAHAHGIPSLHGHLDGLEAWVGPALFPGHSGCWNCFRLRRLAASQNVSASHEVDAARIAERPPERANALLAPMAPIVGQLLAMDALRLLGLGDEANKTNIAGSFHVMDLLTGNSKRHRFIPMPWCDVCGGAAKVLPDKSKAADENGRASEGFVLDLVHDSDGLRNLLGGWIDSRAGVVTELMTMPTGQENVLPRTASASLAVFTTGHLHGSPQPMIGSGKSLTRLGAEIGAVGEAIERYSASRFRRDAMRYASLEELDGDAFDPGTMSLYLPEQYEDEQFPCSPWNPSQKIHWVEGQWLGCDEPVWVPALPTFFNFMAAKQERFCQVSSNGLAAGGDVRDAAVRATFELLERDAFMLAWLCKLPARRLLIDTDLSPELTRVVDQIKAQGAELELWVLDDLGTGIPTVVSLGLGDGKTWGGTSLGLSCHADIRVAARKALLEQAHFGPYLTRLMQTSAIPETPQQVRTLEDHALYYVPPERRTAFDFLRSSDAEPLCLSTCEAVDTNDIDLYRYVGERLQDAGLRIAFVDVTSPDVMLSPFRVARALGEHVQPIHFGWHMRPLANERLNSLLAGRAPNADPHPIA